MVDSFIVKRDIQVQFLSQERVLNKVEGLILCGE